MARMIEPIKDCLSTSMWEEDGIQYRSNLLHKVGAKVALHSHSFDHTAKITGKMKMIVNDWETEVTSGAKIFIPAGAQHSFELIEGNFGEVLCYWKI